MNTDAYIHAKLDQLKKWEDEIDTRAVKVTDAWHAKRDDVVKKLEALKTDTTDRLDVLRMGFESAWAELKTAFETVIAKDPNATHHGVDMHAHAHKNP